MNCTVALQGRCGIENKGKFDHIIAWHDYMFLADCKFNPAANSLPLQSGRTSGNKCSWHNGCTIVFLPIR